MMIFLLLLMACTGVPEVVEPEPIELPPEPRLEEVVFEPLYVITDAHGNIRYADDITILKDGESVVGKIYVIDREELENYIKNYSLLYGYIDKLKKRIDPEYEPLLE